MMASTFTVGKKYLEQNMCAINDPLGQTHTVLPVAITILIRKSYCFARIWKVGTDVCTFGQTNGAKMVITTGRDCGSVE